MTTLAPFKPGRPADKRRSLVEHLRRQIIEGRLGPGEQLPTQVALKGRFGVSNDTVQSAFHELRDGGYVQSLGRGGTVVAERPPHLHRFGLVFVGVPQLGLVWSRWNVALAEAARRLDGQADRRIATYQLDQGRPDAWDYPALLNDIYAGRLAGLVFSNHPHKLIGTPVLESPGLPRIAITSAQHFHHVAHASPDMNSFLDKAVAHVCAAGRKRLGVIAMPLPDGPCERDRLPAMCREAGLTLMDRWNFSFTPECGVGIRNAVELLMSAPPDERPDALLVLDDNLVEQATAGVAAAGVSAPRDVTIIAACNFPTPPSSSVPVTRLGFDMEELLRRCLDAIVAQRRGGRVDNPPPVEALFERELAELAARRRAVEMVM